MKGDFTRIPRRRSRRFSGVRLQQGRVQLDADFNEQAEIESRRDRLTARDVVGPAGAPEEGGGFRVSPAVRLDAIALSGSNWAIAGELGSVLASSDSGSSWHAHHAPPGTADLHGVAILAAGKVVAVGAAATIVHGDDAWVEATVPSDLEADLRAVSFADADHGWAVGDGATILHTDNGGEDWEAQGAPAGVDEDLHAVHCVDTSRCWAVGDGGRIVATTDGKSWAVQSAPEGFEADLRAVRFADADRGWAVGGGATILASEDGGASWELRDPPAGVGATLRGLALRRGGHLWAVGEGGLVIASEDNGSSWVELDAAEASGGVELTAVAASDDRVIATGELSTVIEDAGEGFGWQRAAVPDSARDLAISAGRFYVDGTPIEAERGVRLLDQPDLAIDELPGEAGRYLVYLDVWQRHLTAVEEPDLREVALGGPDTSTRTRTVWQAKLTAVAEDAECRDFGAEWTAEGSASSGRMRAQAEPDELSDDECAVPAAGGYRRLENQLYRVEVHEGSDGGTPSFVWSRDNGCVLTTLVGEIEPDPESGRPVLSVAETGRDAVGGFFGSRLVELSDERRVLAGEPGDLLEVERVDERRIVLEEPDFDVAAAWGPGALVRRWDGTAPIVADGWKTLEGGVQIQFGSGSYASGDYWTIPARTATAEVEWPCVAGAPQFEPRHGTAHAQTPLALVDLDADGGWTLHDDCRPLFTPLALQTRLSMVGGDGQELDPAASDPELPYPLEVSVMNGRRPVEGARVCFAVLEGDGSLAKLDGGDSDKALPVETGEDGLASVAWTLSPTAERHRVEARLLGRRDERLDAPVHFNARIAPAGREAEPGIRVEAVSTATGKTLRNHGRLTIEELVGGIDILLDREVEPGTVRGKPTCLVAIGLPVGPDGQVTYYGPRIGMIPVTLGAEVGAEGQIVQWRPGPQTSEWLTGVLSEKLADIGAFLAYLTLKGNFVYALGEPRLNVDGEVFGVLNEGRLEVELPSGDGRRGGDLEMWFQLHGEGQFEPKQSEVLVMLYVRSELLGDVRRRWTPFAKALDLGLRRVRLREALPKDFALDREATFDPAAARKLVESANLGATYRAIAEPELLELGNRMDVLLQEKEIPIKLETTASEDLAGDVARIRKNKEQLDVVICSEQAGRRLAAELPDLFQTKAALRL